MEYTKYLKTKHWQETRKLFWKSGYKKQCYCCGKEGILLDLHHKTYKSIGREKLTHLALVCRSCHTKIHALHKQKPRNGLWWATSKIRRKTGFYKASNP